ncbi:MAG: outer membrane protein assembly factor BamA [Alkalispirochaetaceae bacterium]
MHRIFPVLLALLITVPLFAQSDGEWYQDKPIQDITFEGLETVSRNELGTIIEPYLGQPFTDQRFLELQRRLYALDYFEEIIPEAIRADEEGSAVILNFQVTERPVVDRVEFTGNNRVGRNQLLSDILLTRGDMITRSQRRVDEEAIVSAYIERGYPDVEVSSRVAEEDGRTILYFDIQEGSQLTIEEIRFEGNSFATDSTLRGVIQSNEQSLFNRGVYQDRMVEQDRNRIERWYQERGYVDATVTEVARDVERSEEEMRSSVRLTFFIEEGELYTFGGIDFQGNTIFSDEELRGLVRLDEGDTLDLTRLDADYQRVADRYYQNGYIFNQITREANRDEDENVISYTVNIVERNRAHIENIIIRGNEKTEDFVLYREIPLEVGDVFSATKIRQGLQNLANLQYFSAITPETPEGSAEGLMDLVVNVEETTTADITFGVAFGGNQEFPVSAQVRWQDRNFRGRGQTFGIDTSLSPITQTLNFNFTEPWLFGQRWSGGVDFSVERSRITGVPQDILAPVFSSDEEDEAVPDPFTGQYVFTEETTIDGVTYEAGEYFPGDPSDENVDLYDLERDYDYAGGGLAAIPDEYLMEYNAWNFGLSGSTGYTFQTVAGRLRPGTSIGTRLNYITYDESIYRPFNASTRDNLNSWRVINFWRLGLSLDDRDIVFSPSSGYLLDQSLVFYGGFLFGDRHFIRSESKAQAFVTLWDWPVFDNWNWKMVLGAESSFDMVFPHFFYPGDSDYETDGPGEQYLIIQDGIFNSRGWPRDRGEALWNNWLELRMPLAEQVIWWDTFLEGARLWQDREDIGSGEGTINDWKFTMGSGVRFVIPQFPIRLYIAKRFLVEEDGTIDWQTGNLFNRGGEEGRGVELVFSIGAEFF